MVCGSAGWQDRSRPARESGARIETRAAGSRELALAGRPARESGARIETYNTDRLGVTRGGRPARESGARIETRQEVARP